jgi:HEPN domain-containing protein
MSDSEKWLAFAQDDLRVAELCLENGVFSMACFHCQQAVEKLLKGYRVAIGHPYPKTHTLRQLLKLCTEVSPEFRELEPQCRSLDRFYAPARYPDAAAGSLPGGLPGKEDADLALTQSREVASFVKRHLEQGQPSMRRTRRSRRVR